LTLHWIIISVHFQLKKSIFGENHQDVATSYNNIGGIYNSKGEFDTALDYYQRSLSIKISIFGDNHTRTHTTQQNIRICLNKKAEKKKNQCILF